MRWRILDRPMWLGLGLLPLAFALRLYHLDYQNLWLDEALTWWDSQLPAYWLFRQSALNVHPPGVYFLLKLWTTLFGTNPAMLRLPFLFCSLLIIVLTLNLTRRLLPSHVAVLAALFLTLSPYQVYYAQEARMYTLATALASGAVLCYLRLWPWERLSPLAGLGFVLLFAAALQTHYFSAFILAAVNVHFLFETLKTRQHHLSERRRLGPWIGLNTGILLVCAPWVLFLMLHPGVYAKQDWRPSLSLAGGFLQLRDLFLSLTIGYNISPGDLPYAFKNYLTYPQATDARQFLLHRFLTLGVGLPLTVSVFIKGVWRARQQAGEILFFFFVPLLLILLILAIVQRQMQLSRYLMMASPYFSVLLAVGVVSLKTSVRQIVAASAIALAMACGLMTYYHTPTRGSDYRPVADIIKRDVCPGDVIVAEPFYMDRCLFYYLESPSLRRAVMNTEWLGPLSNYLARRSSLPRIWVILDHRSPLFETPPDELCRLWPSYKIQTDTSFPEQFPTVRLLQLRFTRQN